MSETIGAGIIIKDEKETIRQCLKSIALHVDQIVVVIQNNTSEKTISEIKKGAPKAEIHNFGEWINDFAAKRNFCFSKLKTDWLFWIDADDFVYQPENLRKLIPQMSSEVGAIWFHYHYARDEFGNVTTDYERERLLRARYGWIWQSRVHETLSPLMPCKHVRTGDNIPEAVIIVHQGHRGGEDRGVRNFHILELMLREEPNNKRIWLYMGHQHFAASNWMEASKWYLKFGSDAQALPLERFQALCYASRALREMKDPQAVDVALMAVSLCPEYKDGYLELAHSYLSNGELDKAIHFALLSDTKDLMKQPPSLIFINPLDYTFNRYCLLAEAYNRKQDIGNAYKYLQEAARIRPTKQIQEQVKFLDNFLLRQRVIDGIKVLGVHLLNNQELVKLRHLKETVPFWFRDTPDFQQLSQGIDHYTSQITNDPEIVEGENKSVLVNLGTVVNPEDLLKELDKKYEKITLIAPFPLNGVKVINTYCQSDIERLIISAEGRYILNLFQDDNRIVCEYCHKAPQDLIIRMWLGQGLEYWSPKTIEDIGCGGSETAMAMLAKNLFSLDCQTILYAMDRQVWDGVLYRHFSQFNPEGSPSHLFISSRVPDIFNQNIQAEQKWLWCHDIHCWDKLTPDIAEQLNAIVALSNWHVGHLKRVYPFLADAPVVDLDNNKVTFEDSWTAQVFHPEGTCQRLPVMAIIGNALDISRFNGLRVKKEKNLFIWCSSPDRGLEELLSLWGSLKKQLPDARLKIFYGWEYFNSSLFIPAQREFKERLKLLLKQPGVEWCGRVGQKQLALELLRAEAIIYPPPHSFRETYGITFLEAQAAGVLCFYRENGALGETIGDRGIPLPMNMTPDEIVATVVSTLQNKVLCDKLRGKGKEYAASHSWAKQAEKIKLLYQRLKENG